METDPLDFAHPATRAYFEASFDAPTLAQTLGFPPISRLESTLLLAPTGSGKTLAAFLAALDRLCFGELPPPLSKGPSNDNLCETRTSDGAQIASAPDAEATAERIRPQGTDRVVAKATATKGGRTQAARWVSDEAAVANCYRSAGPKRGSVRVLYVSPLKALGVDVERNLRAPLAGLVATADRLDHPCRRPTVGIRTGDTPAAERARQARKPPDILITTPESLYLWLTSQAAAGLVGVETVIVDEIHALVATKRGAHLALSLERLEDLRERAGNRQPLQRIGLSATQRPLDEVARFLGGFQTERGEHGQGVPRPVSIVDASAPKRLTLTVAMPAEEELAAGLTAWKIEGAPGGESDGTAATQRARSVWPAIYPKLLALIRAHRTTLLFVNSRRLAERISQALNELAGEELCRAHHGSVSREARQEIEERLKAGLLPALLCTSTLELGIDMGAVDLVIQIEAPLTVAAGLQRVGRAGHQVGGHSIGHLFPKYRADLLACATVTERMDQGLVEETHYPRNPLDVLTQQIVAAVAQAGADGTTADALYTWARRAAPFSELSRGIFDGVLDLVSGRYPTQALGSLTDARPSVVWDRLTGRITARAHARSLAVLNGGTIADRGLYGVYLVDAGEAGAKSDAKGRGGRRVGELDEEMVLESRAGEIFVLGATSWRIEEITFDRVYVSPAGAQPGKMPFWRGEGNGRAPELGEAIGAMGRTLVSLPVEAARERLRSRSHLDENAADVLMAYLNDQREATVSVPSDTHLVVERFRDEIGDWRVCVLSPYGARVHAPWVTAITARLAALVPGEVEPVHTNDGFAFRMPDQETLPDLSVLFPDPEEIEGLVIAHLAQTSLFAARFRENAARSLLLPKRDPRRRTALWQIRKRASDLMAAALVFPDFPIVLETYRECLRDVFDVPALQRVLTRIRSREILVSHVESRRPSPFAASMLFGYVANFLYDGDQPVAERRARALTLDHARLKELLGEAELRELFKPDELGALERRLQRLAPLARCPDAESLHDLLWRLGDLSADELALRVEGGALVADGHLSALRERGRIVEIKLAGERRNIVIEDVARYRDALGVMPPPGTPMVYLEAATAPLVDLVARYARTHGPFVAMDVARRLGTGRTLIEGALGVLCASDTVVTGSFSPERTDTEYCDAEVLRALKRTALSRLRRAVEPVSVEAFARFRLAWHGLEHRRRGAEALLSVIERLQGVPMPASALEREILPARIADYTPGMLDALCIAGEVVFRGVESIGDADGRIALYLTDHAPLLSEPVTALAGAQFDRIRDVLSERGAVFFSDLLRAVGGFAPDVEAAVWQLVWNGEVTNDTLAPLRSRLRGAGPQRSRRGRAPAPGYDPGGRAPAPGYDPGGRGQSFGGFTSRRTSVPGTEGRFSLWPVAPVTSAEQTARWHARTLQALERDGVLVREPGEDFARLYPVLRALEEAGRLRRGYFVEGLGGSQFALPGAEERLRGHREAAHGGALLLAACDPANPHGAVLPWPRAAEGRAGRAAGTKVVLQAGALRGFVTRGGRGLLLAPFLPSDAAERAESLRAVAGALALAVHAGGMAAFTLEEIDGEPASTSTLAGVFVAAGFRASSQGLTMRRASSTPTAPTSDALPDDSGEVE